MAEPNLRIKRSRGFNSIIRGKQLDDFMRKAIKDQMEPFAEKEYKKYTDRFDLKPKVETNVQVGQERGQVMTIRITGTKVAVDRWNMIDTEGRAFKKDALKSTKFKTVKRKTKTRTSKTKNVQGAHFRPTEKGGTYKRLIPMPIRTYNSKVNKYGKLADGDGTYDEDNVVFRTKANLGAVTPAYITRDLIAPVVRKRMTVVVENAYRRAFRAITGRGI